MTEHRPEVADVFRAHEKTFGAVGQCTLTQQRKAFNDISDCRTAALGATSMNVISADTVSSPITRAAIGIARSVRQQLAPSGSRSARRSCCRFEQYFHVVFTLPQEIAALALQTPEIYNLLFRSSSETLLKIAADPKHLGASIGFWLCSTPGGKPAFASHLHCVVPGGGIPGRLALDRLPQVVLSPRQSLSRLFRKKFLLYLKKAFGKASFGSTASWRPWQDRRLLKHFAKESVRRSGSFTPSRRLEDPNRRSSIWPATPPRGHFQPSHRVVGGWSSHLHTPGLR